MRRIFAIVAAAVVGLCLGVAIVGCDVSTPSGKEKMGGDKMGGDKMGGDKMGSDKMGGDKMGGDKMKGDANDKK